MSPKYIKKFFKSITHSDYGQFYLIADYHRIMVMDTEFMSWSADNYRNVGGKFLHFKVKGKKFKGRVFIGVCEGDVLLDIFFTKTSGEIVRKFDDIFMEDFIDIIDKFVETD